jgi:hypothetical protein
MWHFYLAVLIHLFLQRAVSQITPSEFPVPNIRVFYCPFDVNVTLAPDVTWIDLTFTASESQQFFSQETAKCYVQYDFPIPATDNATISVYQMEYSGDFEGSGSGELETAVVWYNNYGPVRASAACFANTC